MFSIALAAAKGPEWADANKKVFGATLLIDVITLIALPIFAGLAASGALMVAAGGCYALFTLTGFQTAMMLWFANALYTVASNHAKNNQSSESVTSTTVDLY